MHEKHPSASKHTDHENTSPESFRGQGGNTNLRSDSANGLALVLSFAEKRDKGVGWVRNDGADNTSEVTRRECDTELCALAVCVLGLSEDVGVEELDDLFEAEELGHCVRDLVWK